MQDSSESVGGDLFEKGRKFFLRE